MPKKIKGPTKGVLTAAFDGKAKSVKSVLSRSAITNPSTLVLLSIVGNERCTGDYLQAITEQALQTCGKTLFLIADELYWHNLKGLTNSESEIRALKEQAISMGSEYITKNLPFFLNALEERIAGFKSDVFIETHQGTSAPELLTAVNSLAREHDIPFEVITWREWIASADGAFIASQTQIMALYESEPELKHHLETTTNAFVKRYQKRPVDLTDEAMVSCAAENKLKLLQKRSRDYLSEESPAIFWLAGKRGINFIAYPGDEMEVFKATSSFLIRSVRGENTHPLSIQVEDPAVFANWLQINFKRKRQVTNVNRVRFNLSPEPDSTGRSLGINRSKSLSALPQQCFFQPEDPKSNPDTQVTITQIDQQLRTIIEKGIHSRQAKALLAGVLARLTSELSRPDTPIHCP